MKPPTVAEVARAFKIPTADLMDTQRLHQRHPPLQFARSAFVMLRWYADPKPLYLLSRDLGLADVTAYRWRDAHDRHMRNPYYAEIFAKLAGKAA